MIFEKALFPLAYPLKRVVKEGGGGGDLDQSRFTENKIAVSHFTDNKIDISLFTNGFSYFR